MPLIRNGAEVADDAWVRVADDDPLPEDCHALVSMARWLDERDRLAARNAPIGVALAASDNPDAIMDDLGRFGLIEVEFPMFKDGRGFSYARLIRHRGGYDGELRARGHVLPDQIFYLVRCGFDAIDGDDRITEAAWTEAMSRFTHVYQTTGDGRQSAVQKRHAG